MVAGYCLQIGGGVLGMKESLKLFGVYRKMEFTKTTNYCSFYDNKLNSFVACLYLATTVSILPSFVCSKLFGRRVVVCIGFGLVLLGSILLTIKNLPTLFIGRIICGFGVGCILQALPIYISESTPAEYADFLGSKFDHGFNFGGFVVASTISFLVAMNKSGWRWSFGLSRVLALASLMLSATTPESPHYFLEMKDIERAKNAFKKTRGRLIVAEFDNLVAKSEKVYSSLFHPFRLQYMPYLFIACVREVFMQMTGMFAINFFTPIFLTSIGVSASTSFISSMGVGCTYFIMAILGGMLVDRYKRRVMLRSSSLVMIFTLFIIFGLL
ncbi:sugar transport protein 1-like [Quercus lobata]|uniref:sugar transport protein 1-like n=1 Tax=Quercus lobata TaxID=97700 RepID=UPI001244BA7F|nr:sugar transport protein 1-like [Quercus lobata]